MRVRTENLEFQGQAGLIDCAIDHPAGEARGWALVLHPHPLHGGTRDNKVITTMARACADHGLLALRPNFRGVGRSGGEFDQAVGETADMLALLTQFHEGYLAAQAPALREAPWVLAGFSFGTAVAAQVHAGLAEAALAPPRAVVLAGTAVERFRYREVDLPADTLLVHGETDDVVPLAEAMDFARPRELPVVVLPGAGHFFHGRLLSLRQLVRQHLAAVGLPASAE